MAKKLSSKEVLKEAREIALLCDDSLRHIKKHPGPREPLEKLLALENKILFSSLNEISVEELQKIKMILEIATDHYRKNLEMSWANEL